MTDIIVEDGSIVANANSYVTISGTDAYALDYAYADWTAATETVKTQSLFRGMRYIESLSFKGTKQTEGQALAWPITDLYDIDGYLIEDNTIPAQVVKATYEAAIICLPTSGIDLQPNKDADDYRTKLNIAGVVTEEWYNRGRLTNKSTIITDLLKGLIKSSYIIEVQRG